MPTFDSPILPNASGLNLGSASQRWNIFASNIDVGGTTTSSGGGTGGLAGGTTIGTNYLAVAGDNGKLLSFNGSNLVLTLPNPVPSATWGIFVENTNATALTVSRNGLVIDGAGSNLTIVQNTGLYITTDGFNYLTQRGISSALSTTPPSTFPLAVTSLNAFGDSITLGFGLPAVSVSSASNQSWAALFGKMFNTLVATNYGVSGAPIWGPSFIDNAYIQSPSAAVGSVTIPFSNDYSDY